MYTSERLNKLVDKPLLVRFRHVNPQIMQYRTMNWRSQIDTVLRYDGSAPAAANHCTVERMDRRMNVRCQLALYNDITQFYWQIFKNLHRRMILRYRRYTVHSLAGVGEISTLIVQSPSFAGFCELNRQVQFNCCLDAESGFILLSWRCSFKFKKNYLRY